MIQPGQCQHPGGEAERSQLELHRGVMYGGALKRVDEQPDAGAAEVIHGPQVQGDRAAGVEVVQQRTAQPGCPPAPTSLSP